MGTAIIVRLFLLVADGDHPVSDQQWEAVRASTVSEASWKALWHPIFARFA